MKKYDYLIVGSGLAGSTLANKLYNQGKKVIVIDQRNHIGGNCYDYHDNAGVLIHKYGPHYFRTNYQEVIDFLSEFTSWIPQKYKVKISIGDNIYSFPINRTTINQVFNLSLKTQKETQAFLDSQKIEIDSPKNAEEQVLALAGQKIYDLFFKNYTLKQWGIHPRELDPSVTARIPIRTTKNDDYVNAKFQAMPKDGYGKMFNKMLKDIPVVLNMNYETAKKVFDHESLIYTGPIDQFFNYNHGKLPYRSLKFEFKTYPKKYFQRWGQINYPNEHKYTRIVEIKHITKQKSPFTTISIEYPQSQGDPYYPIPNPTNEKLYQKYELEAKKLNNTYFIGRLAQYRYINMDQTVHSALELYKELQNK